MLRQRCERFTCGSGADCVGESACALDPYVDGTLTSRAPAFSDARYRRTETRPGESDSGIGKDTSAWLGKCLRATPGGVDLAIDKFAVGVLQSLARTTSRRVRSPQPRDADQIPAKAATTPPSVWLATRRKKRTQLSACARWYRSTTGDSNHCNTWQLCVAMGDCVSHAKPLVHPLASLR